MQWIKSWTKFTFSLHKFNESRRHKIELQLNQDYEHNIIWKSIHVDPVDSTCGEAVETIDCFLRSCTYIDLYLLYENYNWLRINENLKIKRTEYSDIVYQLYTFVS